MPETDETGFVSYASPDAPFLKIMTPSGPMKFDNGTLKTDNPEVIAYIEDCLNEGGDLCRYVRRVQFETAEKIARAFRASQLAKEQIATGSTSTAHLGHEIQKTADRRVEIEQMTGSAEEAAKVAAEMEKSDLMLTKKVDQSAAVREALRAEDEAAAAKTTKVEPPAAAPKSISDILGTGR